MMQLHRAVFFLLLLVCTQIALPCSMVKLTSNGKTFVGNNEDSWRINPKISFVPSADGKYGVVYIGANREDFSEGAVNEAGLVYDGFTVMPKPAKTNGLSDLQAPPTLLKDIMETCATIAEVKAKLAKYNSYFFETGMLLMVDKSGRYIVIEPDTILEGNDAKYLLSNFCPSITPEKEVPQMRYWRGKQFLTNRNDADLAIMIGVMDTMSECRAKMGDGTLYTSIYDLSEGLIHLYFYHDYKHEVILNIKDELAKGKRIVNIADLFPPNTEYAKLCAFQTPFNNNKLTIFIVGSALLFGFSALFFLISFIKTRRAKGVYLKLALAVLSGHLCYYTIHLIRDQSIYYFPPKGSLSYLPLVLLLLFVPLLIVNIRSFRSVAWSRFAAIVFSINSVVYLVLLVLFDYWGLLVVSVK